MDPQETLWHESIHTQGILGVAVFFVLSGLLLSLPFWKATWGMGPRPEWGDYAVARGIRILPAYYVCLVACWVFFPGPNSGIRLLSGLMFTNWAHWKTFYPAPVNAALWSISVEMCFYVMLPIWGSGLMRMRSVRRCFAYWLLTQMIIVLIQSTLISKLKMALPATPVSDPWQAVALEELPVHNPFALFSHFLFGCAAAGWIVSRNRQQPGTHQFTPSLRYDLAWVVCLLTTLFVIHPGWIPNPWFASTLNRAQIWSMQYQWPVFPALAACLLVFSHQSRIVGKLLDHGLLRSVCRISYGIYLWHMVVLDLVCRWCPWSLTSLSRQIGCSIVCLILTMTLATGSFYWIERPSMSRFFKWYRRDRIGRAALAS